MSIIIFLVILGILVLVHEFGHFIIAKKSGILVEEFGFGFPPRIWSKKIGETLYSLNLFPIGGFVKLYGEEYQEIKQKQPQRLLNRAFVFKKPWQKALVVLGGVMMNIVLAVFIYYVLITGNNFQSEPLPLFKNYQFRFGQQEGRVIVASVVKDSPAYYAGVKSEDIVIRIKTTNNQWIAVKSSQQLINYISNLSSVPVLIEFVNLKNNQQNQVKVTPFYDKELSRSIIGIKLIDSVIIKYQTPTEKLLSGFYHSYNMTIYNVKTIGFLIKTAYKEKKVEIVSQSVSGPIGIFSIIQDLVKTSGEKFIINFLNVLAALSLSLALINIFPFPALDGGRLVFVFYEWIAKKSINKKVESYINLGGFIFLIGLAILISINDIMRLLK